ncbi:MAG: hypothetical protein HUK22_01560 [Thermoguttaceae bacterium]|nr:hypothetical protein [Thermoguttaceae bacterium]
MKKRLLTGVALGFALVCAVGCGPKTPDGMPRLEPTTLTVTQEGANVPDAMITLKALDASNKWTSGGTTDASGVATLVTHGQYKGVPAGKYKVAVTKIVGEGTPPPPSPIDAESARKYQEYIDSGETYEEFYVIAQEYGTIETTPLEIEVVSGKNALTVDVGAVVHDPVQASTGVIR